MDCAPENRDEGAQGPFAGWAGERIVICASGPSQRQEDIEEARHKARVIVINETWRLAPWADALYACDYRWWKARGPAAGEFAGIRFQGFMDGPQGVWDGCIHANVVRGRQTMNFDGDALGSGGNGGFQAVNLAAIARPSRIILLGYDMQMGKAAHWHEDHGAGMSNPDARFLHNCAQKLDMAAPFLKRFGVEVVNASRETALKAFPRMTITEALA